MPKKAKGRTLDEFRPLRPAEEKLLQACETGDVAEISANRPTEKTDANSVRASFLRFLTLGGDEQAPVHDHGVQLNGAWIEGQLALETARVPTNILLAHCHFETAPVLWDARIAGTLSLGGCQVPGIQGDRLTCNGGVFMHQGFITTDEVRLLGAQIGGDITCSGATFDGKEGDSLSANLLLSAG